MTLAILVRGGANQCNKTEWALNYTIRKSSAQREHLHETYRPAIEGMEYFYDVIVLYVQLF